MYIPEWKTRLSEIIHWTGFTGHWTSQKKRSMNSNMSTEINPHEAQREKSTNNAEQTVGDMWTP